MRNDLTILTACCIIHLTKGLLPLRKENIMATEKKKDLGIYLNVVKVTATNHDGNLPENVSDGDYATRWSSDVSGAELVLELDAVHPVSYIGIACFKGDERRTQIGISVSEDGVNYTRVIDKVETEKRTDMGAISLGGTYNARFVKIHGYGNTQGAWTSITEIKIYSPSPDGKMHVDPNGPRQQTVEDLPEHVQEALAGVEKYFTGVIPWLANMYDPKSHGFYMAMSGKLDPEMDTAIEMTCWGLSFLAGYTDACSRMPEWFRADLEKYFNDRQDPETGMFIDFQGPVNPRETARNQDSALGGLGIVRAQPKYPHPRNAASKKSEADAPIMPDFMQSVDKYIEWVSNHNWEGNSWGSGDQTQASQQYIKMLSPEMQEKYKSALFAWFEEHQRENGLWSDCINFNSCSGAFKVGLIYGMWGKKLPNYDKIIDTIFECYRTTKTDNPFYVRNPISVLCQMQSYGEETKKKIQDCVVENIDAMLSSFGDFLCPDGAFSSRKWYVGATYFGGVKGSHGLYEGDIDATLMILIARKQIYALFDIKAPYLNTDDFWDWIEGKKPMPDPYAAVADIVKPLPEDMKQYDFSAWRAEKGW